MIRKRFLKLFFVLSSLSASVYGLDDVIRQPKPTNSFTQEEIDQLKEWIKSKRQTVGIKSLGGELTYSGEVRTGMNSVSEVVNGVRQRGAGGAIPGYPSRDYSIEVGILMNYRADFTWATSKIRFKNRAGVISGTSDKVALDRGFMGVRLVEGESYAMVLEAGRRKFNYTFDSKIEFGSFMDGLVFKYDQSIDVVGDLYFYGGPFVIDFTGDHYGYMFELGALNVGNTGIYLKYSFIDWDTKHYDNILKKRRFEYMNSQLTLGYKVVVPYIQKVLTIYSAALNNSAARALPILDDKKANWAGYLGFSLGEVRKQGDWSIDIDYQWVQAQAVPAYDFAGIGRGNAAGVGLYAVDSKDAAPTTKLTATGPCNYKGFEATFLYLFTNNLTLRQTYQMSTRLQKIGPIYRYKAYSMELVYLY